MDWAATLTTAGSILSSAKSLYDRLAKRGDKRAAETALAVFEATKNLQSDLLQAQKENVELQAAIGQLRSENAELKAQSVAVDDYEQRQVGQGVVLVKTGTTEPYYCPNCAQTKHAHLPLQRHPMRSRRFGTHYCSSCKTSFRL